MANSTFTVDKEKLEVRTERVFDTSPARLFKAYSDPEQILQWWGPRRMTMRIDKMDFRVGGIWRFIHIDPEGKEYAFNGIYKEIDEPNKIVDTFEYEPMPGHGLVETITFEEQPDGKTKLTVSSRYDSLDDLEGMVSMGMEKGQTESMERLSELVEN
jgi:uncharacterized protein YndB with AHSA1/START domain